MKKLFFIATIVLAIIFISCAPTKIKALSDETESNESTVSFKDFFNPIVLVNESNLATSAEIVVDKNTGVLYVRKYGMYQWGMSPIYDSDGSVMTKTKWLEKYSKTLKK